MMIRLLPRKRDGVGAWSSADNGEDIVASQLVQPNHLIFRSDLEASKILRECF